MMFTTPTVAPADFAFCRMLTSPEVSPVFVVGIVYEN